VLFLFWAASTVPIAILVAGYGGQRRGAAAARLLAYWGLGSAALLAGILLLYNATGSSSFDLSVLGKAAPSPASSSSSPRCSGSRRRRGCRWCRSTAGPGRSCPKRRPAWS